MPTYNSDIAQVLLSFGAALVLCFITTPLVRKFAKKVGAVDSPRDRHHHKTPTPYFGGLAIFAGFVVSTLIFSDMPRSVQSILMGSVVVVITGAIDDLIDLKWWIKTIAQFGAALIVVLWGEVRVDYFTNPFAGLGFGGEYIYLGWFGYPATVLWIFAITNAVNLIDGLDGLACGVSAIASATMLVTALLVGELGVAIVLASLFGSCIGFLPYNRNPAKIFMGDAGAYLLGFVLSTMSVLGLFKFYAAISSFIPFLILAVPIFDEIFVSIRRIAKGQKPWHADRGHVHYSLVDMGLSHKHAVAVCYCASTVVGLLAVVITTDGGFKAFLFGLVFVAAAILAVIVFRQAPTFDSSGSEAEPSAELEAPSAEATDTASADAEVRAEPESVVQNAENEANK